MQQKAFYKIQYPFIIMMIVIVIIKTLSLIQIKGNFLKLVKHVKNLQLT